MSLTSSGGAAVIGAMLVACFTAAAGASSATMAAPADPPVVTYDGGGHGIGTASAGGPPITRQQELAALVDDARHYAKQARIPEAVATDILVDQNAMDPYLKHLAEAYPSQYAGTWYTHEPGLVAHVRFVGPVPAAARVELPPGVKVDLVPNGGANLTDSTAALDEVTKLVQGMPWSTVSYDVSTQRITIEAGTALRTRVQDALSDYRGSVPVDVKYSDQDIEVDFQVNVRGGGYFNGPGAACTTGFSVIYYQGGVGTRGTATAAHCRLFVGGAWNYNDPSASGSVGTTRAGYGFGTGWGDLEVATTPGDELPAFYSNGAGSIMPVSNWGAPPAGTVICVNGRATGKHCAPIINPEFAYNTGGYSFTRMVKTPNPNTADGDSGAPWFYGSKAVGIHSAVALINGVYYGIASNVTYLSNTTGLNAVILTQ